MGRTVRGLEFLLGATRYRVTAPLVVAKTIPTGERYIQRGTTFTTAQVDRVHIDHLLERDMIEEVR